MSKTLKNGQKQSYKWESIAKKFSHGKGLKAKKLKKDDKWGKQYGI